MLNFVFILLIFLEVILTCFLFKKILPLIEKINVLNEKLTKEVSEYIEIIAKTKNGIKTFNKIFEQGENEKIKTVKKITQVAIIFVQLFFLYKSLEVPKDSKVMLKNVKKILLSGVTREMLKKLLNHVRTRSCPMC